MREGCGGFTFHYKHSGNLNGNPAVSIGKERKIKKMKNSYPAVSTVHCPIMWQGGRLNMETEWWRRGAMLSALAKEGKHDRLQGNEQMSR